MKTTKRFSESDVKKLESGLYWFECAMVSVCRPAFDDCGSNYEVEKKLRDAKVIGFKNHTDTEFSALVVNFRTEEAGRNFINRLNAYFEA
jgi:hypothetical protein